MASALTTQATPTPASASTARHTRLALRVRIDAPIASFRDPMFGGIQAGLPVPPPSTVRGLLAAAHGSFQQLDQLGPLQLALAVRIGGEGEDLETYHPLTADGLRRWPGTEQGPRPLTRPFVIDLELTLWVLTANPDDPQDLQRHARALRRPVWPLRLGRSQDLIRPGPVDIVPLTPATTGMQGHALVPLHTVAQATPPARGDEYRLPTWVALDRLRSRYQDFIWSRDGGSQLGQVHGALTEPTNPQRQLIWPVRCDPNANGG
jgi:CRISPR-associated Cas5-like protein